MLTSEKITEGRHVGLDFYDLLIEALMGLDSELKANAIIGLNAERYDIRLC